MLRKNLQKQYIVLIMNYMKLKNKNKILKNDNK